VCICFCELVSAGPACKVPTGLRAASVPHQDWDWDLPEPMLLCGTKQCLGQFPLAEGYLLCFSLKQACGQMGGRHLSALNRLTNCKVSSARGQLGFGPTCCV